MGLFEDFAKAIQKDPSLASRLQKTGELTEFKEKYNVDKASGLKCPVCAVFFQFPGSLWLNRNDHTKFVCRKCLLEFVLACLTLPNDTLMGELKTIGKGEQTLPSWMKGNITGDED